MSYAGRFITGSSTGPFVAQINNDGGTSAVPTLAGIWTLTGGTTGLTFGGALNTTTLAGTLGIANGGTNATSMTNTYGVNYFDGTRIVTTTVGTAGQVLTSNGAGVAPTFQAPLPGYLTYEEITAATKTIVNNYEYGANNAGGVAFTLPASAAAGTRFAITGIAGLWNITQGASQVIRFGSTTTTAGAGTKVVATDAGDSITCTCIVADTVWRITNAVGNLTVS